MALVFSNSPLVCKTKLSNKFNERNQPITKITIHHAAGVMTFDNLLNYVANCGRDMSSNYVLRQGKLGLVVEERNRAWTSSSAKNDYQAVTIEVGNSSSGGQWPIADVDLEMLIKWCADVCKRNKIPKLYYDGTPNGTLTLHEMFAPTGCPGPYIKSKLDYICTQVNALLGLNEQAKPTEVATYKVVTDLYGYASAANAVNDVNRKRTVKAGTYSVYNETDKAVNVTLNPKSPGAWICKTKNVVSKPTTAKPTTVKKEPTLESIAREVLAGEWGNGTTRTKGLTAAGYNADNVQKAVNAILSKKSVPNLPLYTNNKNITSTPKKSVKVVAQEVIDGKWGNGDTRKKKLEAAGYNYAEVQKSVNELMSGTPAKSVETVAKEVLQGKWGNGSERKKKLEAAGYNYTEVQKAVNKLM